MGRPYADHSAASLRANGTHTAPQAGATMLPHWTIIGHAAARPYGKDVNVHEFDLEDGTQKRPPWWFKAIVAAGLAGAAGLLATVIALHAY